MGDILHALREALAERSEAIHDASIESGYDTLHRDPRDTCQHPTCVTDRALLGPADYGDLAVYDPQRDEAGALDAARAAHERVAVRGEPIHDYDAPVGAGESVEASRG